MAKFEVDRTVRLWLDEMQQRETIVGARIPTIDDMRELGWVPAEEAESGGQLRQRIRALDAERNTLREATQEIRELRKQLDASDDVIEDLQIKVSELEKTHDRVLRLANTQMGIADHFKNATPALDFIDAVMYDQAQKLEEWRRELDDLRAQTDRPPAPASVKPSERIRQITLERHPGDPPATPDTRDRIDAIIDYLDEQAGAK